MEVSKTWSSLFYNLVFGGLLERLEPQTKSEVSLRRSSIELWMAGNSSAARAAVGPVAAVSISVVWEQLENLRCWVQAAWEPALLCASSLGACAGACYAHPPAGLLLFELAHTYTLTAVQGQR